ncbi:hypothetical protein [Flavobacterium sp.]|uniref:hypothetical protein n=1 Tax=Flavobacterium sp. TaxID=239 RepID=UPI00263A2A76|nr:hypothetical protein [Flavobacterium sp.]
MTLSDATNAIKYFELLTCIVAFFNYKKLKGTCWQYFPFFLMAVFLMECVGYYLSEIKDYKSNVLLYKYVVIPFTFYFNVYIFKNILSKKAHYFLMIGSLIFTLSLLLESTWLASYHTFFASLSLSIANLFILMYVLVYYAELVDSEELIEFHRSISFWFATGVLVFYLGCLPYFGLYNILAEKYFKTIFIPYTWIFVILNYIMYTLFSIGLAWSKKK